MNHVQPSSARSSSNPSSLPPPADADDTTDNATSSDTVQYNAETYTPQVIGANGVSQNYQQQRPEHVPSAVIPTTQQYTYTDIVDPSYFSSNAGSSNIERGGGNSKPFDDEDVIVDMTKGFSPLAIARHVGRNVSALFPFSSSSGAGPTAAGGGNGIFTTAASDVIRNGGLVSSNRSGMASSSSPFSMDFGCEERYSLVRVPRKTQSSSSSAMGGRGGGHRSLFNAANPPRVLLTFPTDFSKIDPSLLSEDEEDQMKLALLLSDPNRALYESGAVPVPRHLRLSVMRTFGESGDDDDDESAGERGLVTSSSSSPLAASLLKKSPIQSRIAFVCAAARQWNKRVLAEALGRQQKKKDEEGAVTNGGAGPSSSSSSSSSPPFSPKLVLLMVFASDRTSALDVAVMKRLFTDTKAKQATAKDSATLAASSSSSMMPSQPSSAPPTSSSSVLKMGKHALILPSTSAINNSKQQSMTGASRGKASNGIGLSASASGAATASAAAAARAARAAAKATTAEANATISMPSAAATATRSSAAATSISISMPSAAATATTTTAPLQPQENGGERTSAAAATRGMNQVSPVTFLRNNFECLFLFASPTMLERAGQALVEEGITTTGGLGLDPFVMGRVLTRMQQQQGSQRQQQKVSGGGGSVGGVVVPTPHPTTLTAPSFSADVEEGGRGGQQQHATTTSSASSTMVGFTAISPLPQISPAEEDEMRRAVDLVLFLQRHGVISSYPSPSPSSASSTFSLRPLLPFAAVLHPTTEAMVKSVVLQKGLEGGGGNGQHGADLDNTTTTTAYNAVSGTFSSVAVTSQLLTSLKQTLRQFVGYASEEDMPPTIPSSSSSSSLLLAPENAIMLSRLLVGSGVGSGDDAADDFFLVDEEDGDAL